jgi:hypothetical protein
MVDILYTHVWNWKNKSAEAIPGRGKRIKEDDGGGELNYDILTWVHVTIYPKK